MARFASEAEGRMQEFSQQNLANMAWAFGKLTHHAPSLLDAIGHKATAGVQVGTPGRCPPPLCCTNLIQQIGIAWMGCNDDDDLGLPTSARYLLGVF